jgi:hypothetical protein
MTVSATREPSTATGGRRRFQKAGLEAPPR